MVPSQTPPPAPLPFLVPFVRFAEQLHWTPGYEWGPRRIYDHEIVYVARGMLRMKVGTQEFLAPADHVFFIPPRLINHFRTEETIDSHDIIGIHFDWRPRPDSADFSYYGGEQIGVVESLFREVELIPGWDIEKTPVLDLRGRPRVRTLLHDVIATYAAGSPYSTCQAGALLAVAIAQLAHEATLLQDLTANPHIGADAIRRVQRARELLETRRATPLSVSDVATQVGWTAHHLGRMCREILGTSPYRIQTAARLHLAQEMLRQNNISIAEVARHCGFKEVSHFMSTFKRETGITARQFMLLHRKEGH